MMCFLLILIPVLLLFLRDDIKLMPFKCVSAREVYPHIALVKLSILCRKKPDFISHFRWIFDPRPSPKQPILVNLVDYQIWTTIQEPVYHTDIQMN